MTKTTLSGLLCLALLAGCGGSSEPTGDGGTAPPEERRFLSLGTAPAGGAFFVVGGALAEVASRHTGWEITAEATKGSQENIRRLVAGDLEVALSNAAITYFAVRGESGWDREYPVRAVMTLAPNVALFVTPADSGIASIPDLAGKRVVIGPAGAGFEMFVGPILEAHGLSLDDFDLLHNTQAAAVDMLTDGSADAAFLGGAIPTASITQAATSMDLRLVPFDPEARETLIRDYPFFHGATIPAGTYRGLEEDFAGLNVGSMHLIAAADADAETIHRLVTALWEHRDEVVERHPAGRAIRAGVVDRDTGTPFHPAALRAFAELGVGADDPDVAAAEAASGGEETAAPAEGEQPDGDAAGAPDDAGSDDAGAAASEG